MTFVSAISGFNQFIIKFNLLRAAGRLHTEKAGPGYPVLLCGYYYTVMDDDESKAVFVNEST